MKFSIVSTFILTQGVIAMPWYHTKAKTAGDEITLRIKVSQGSLAPKVLPKKKVNAAVDPRECWPACFEEEEYCPDGWHSKNINYDGRDCWTCCEDAWDEVK
ncbi:pathogenicity protein [Fusarium napiforme]|uniref:Pathogenicity protein n=1 Tax=Fusarium napiforme TaxID=42672 RepID=A0A8H5N9I1_9HYPO|nr:pathogenicity protein [Fusarium napiforme]